MADRNAIDFPGMVTEALVAIRAHPGLARIAAAPYAHIFVDEYQDTSTAQNELLFELAANGAVLSCVGDGDQTIFSYAGADPESLTLFGERLRARTGRTAQVLPLESNYRSAEPIVEIADSVIAHNSRRLSKRMVPMRESATTGPVVTVVEGAMRYAAPWIALQVHQLLESGVNAGEVAVIFRKEGYGSPQESLVTQHLKRVGVPVTADPQERAAVRVLSIHQAKGNEFDHVLCLYLGRNHFPDGRGDPEEERRALYVAATRARDRLYLAGELGAEPDLFHEVLASRVDVNRIVVENLSDVLVTGLIDPEMLELLDLGQIDEAILDWDEADDGD
jgi:superfamily I DNA/RNA helicase